MGAHARIGPGEQVTIDVTAWLDQRTGGTIDDLTRDLLDWATDQAANQAGYETDAAGSDWPATVIVWCGERGYDVLEPGLISHRMSRLNMEVWVVRAVTDQPFPIAVIALDRGQPTVYADTCREAAPWFDADSVDIICAGGHGWTWNTGRELLTADGTWSTLARVFGPSLDAPFSECPHCVSHREGTRHGRCGCDRSAWIVCPICGERCDVELASL